MAASIPIETRRSLDGQEYHYARIYAAAYAAARRSGELGCGAQRAARAAVADYRAMIEEIYGATRITK